MAMYIGSDFSCISYSRHIGVSSANEFYIAFSILRNEAFTQKWRRRAGGFLQIFHPPHWILAFLTSRSSWFSLGSRTTRRRQNPCWWGQSKPVAGTPLIAHGCTWLRTPLLDSTVSGDHWISWTWNKTPRFTRCCELGVPKDLLASCSSGSRFKGCCVCLCQGHGSSFTRTCGYRTSKRFQKWHVSIMKAFPSSPNQSVKEPQNRMASGDPQGFSWFINYL